MSTFSRVSKQTALLALVWSLGVLSGCSHLFYHPSDQMYVRNPEKLDSMRAEVQLTSADGTHLAAWWLPARAGGHRGTVVQFHGNAENMTSHFASLLWMLDEGYDLFVFDYRGYGISDGKPSQEGLNCDAQTAIRYALGRTPIGKPVILYGQSLGGAVLLRAYDDIKSAERTRIKALIIESSFYSYKAIARDVISRSWVTFLLQPLAYVLVSNSFSPEDSIPRVSPTPLLVLHGDQDPVVPFKFGQKIFALAREPKTFFLIPGGGHLGAPAAATEQAHQAVLRFLGDGPAK